MNNAPTSLATFGDEAGEGDHEPAVVRIVKSLVVTESDVSGHAQGGGGQGRGRGSIPMIADKAPIDSMTVWCIGSGDAGRGRVEHRSFTQFELTRFAGACYKKGAVHPF
ncbi:hypothetical protein EU537_07130 [Candidatus Thorarchaeota archaeon]|nr:MAG: hypothetical protein EU537_07130 [Candidatus Thorarchaeota archaeon]